MGGGGGGFNPPIIYLDTWISNIDFLYTGNQRINANMVLLTFRMCRLAVLLFTKTTKTTTKYRNYYEIPERPWNMYICDKRFLLSADQFCSLLFRCVQIFCFKRYINNIMHFQ